MADENHLIEIQVGETGADQVASKLGQVDSAVEKIPSNVNIKVTADTGQAQSALSQVQSQVAFVSEQALQQFRQAVAQAEQQSTQLTSRASTPTLPVPPTPSGGYSMPPTPTGPIRPGGPYSPRPWPTPPSPAPVPPTPPITPPSLPPSTPTGPGFYPPAPKSNISVSETYNPRGYLQTRTITEKGLTDPITGEPMTQRQQEITEGRILADQEAAEREKYKRQFQSSDTEQYRARRLDASGKPLGDVAGAKAQLDLVNKELTSMGSTTGMTSQQLDRYNTLLKRQADLSVDAAGKTKNLGADLLKHTFYIAQAAVVWSTFRAVGQLLDESITKQRELTLETAKFAAVTGQSVDEATAKWKMYADIGVQAGVAQSQLGRTGLIATQMGKGNTADEAMFVRTTTQLEELTGVASSTIAESLSSALRQADKPMSEVAHLGDLIASSLQKIPAAELKDVISALQEAPALAQLWATDFDTAFNIVIEGASRAQEGPENVSGAFMRLSQGLNQIAEGGEKAWTRQNQLLDEFGLKVMDDSGKLRAIPEILKEAAAILPTLSAPRQQEFLSSIAGSSIKPDQLRTIIGGISAFTAALDNAGSKIEGTLTEMTNVIDSSLGQMVKVMDARIEMLKVRGGIIENLMVSLLKSTVGTYGGKQGAEMVGGIAGMAGGSFMGEGEQMRLSFLKSLYGMTPEEADAAIKDWNEKVKNAVNKSREDQGLIGLIGYSQARIQAYEGLRVSDEQRDIALKELANKGTSQSEPSRDMEDFRLNRETGLTKSSTTPRLPSTQNQDPFAVRARGIMQKDLGGSVGWSGESVLPTNQIDLTKYTQDEINQAKQLSVQLAMQELEIMRAKLIAMDLEPAVIDAAVAKRKEELDTTILLLRTQQGLSYETGITASKLQDALNQMDKQKKERDSLFQFRRLKDIDPSQFGQLQNLTQMYDKFLTSIGSPEKQMNINLLLGEQNTFKTMNARMTALQLALEDLTKVEKAQLSGTWNLPSGSTALVPIQSLDIQRWNNSGGIDPAALAGLMGATNQSGDKVKTAVDNSTMAIVNAILSGKMTASEGVKQAKDPAATALALAAAIRASAFEAINAERARLTPGGTSNPPTADRSYDDIENIRSSRDNGFVTNLTNTLSGIAANIAGATAGMGGGLLSAGGGHGQSERSTLSKPTVSPPVNVTMSPLPLKAAFTANLSVVLNGQVLAQVITPILYELMIKMSSTTPTTGGGIGSLR